MRKNSSFILRYIYGKKVLIPIKANEVGDEPILMNDVGADIWNEADHADSIVSLVDSITKNIIFMMVLLNNRLSRSLYLI